MYILQGRSKSMRYSTNIFFYSVRVRVSRLASLSTRPITRIYHAPHCFRPNPRNIYALKLLFPSFSTHPSPPGELKINIQRQEENVFNGSDYKRFLHRINSGSLVLQSFGPL